MIVYLNFHDLSRHHVAALIFFSKIITNIDLDSGLASIDSLLSGSPSFSSNPSLSYHTLPLDEPLDPPLTPPQQQRQNQKNKQMIPCVEESFWNWSKNELDPNIKSVQIWNWSIYKIGPHFKSIHLYWYNWFKLKTSPELKLIQFETGPEMKLIQGQNWFKIRIGPILKLV